MEGKFALIIGNNEFEDSSLACLVSPASEARALADILKDPEIGGFDDVTALVNEPEVRVRRGIASLFARKKPDDLLLLYFSTHGLLDENGLLFLATRDTQRDLLDATSVEAAFVTKVMNNSLSRRQVLILDCCHSGAFARGTKGALGASVSTAAAFEGNGFGRWVLTATDSTQYAWDGDKVVGGGDSPSSVFTRHLIEGLRTGAADDDDDGQISLDELYEYVYRQVLSETPQQTPGKWSYKQQGNLAIARNPYPGRKIASLPDQLQKALESDFPSTREGAIRELERYLHGPQVGLTKAAEQTLEKIGAEDDSRKVQRLAAAVLADFRKTKEERRGSPLTQPEGRSDEAARTEPSTPSEPKMTQPSSTDVGLGGVKLGSPPKGDPHHPKGGGKGALPMTDQASLGETSSPLNTEEKKLDQESLRAQEAPSAQLEDRSGEATPPSDPLITQSITDVSGTELDSPLQHDPAGGTEGMSPTIEAPSSGATQPAPPSTADYIQAFVLFLSFLGVVILMLLLLRNAQ